jgi:hypothetical protein
MTTQPWETDANAVAYEFMTAGGINLPEHIDYLVGDRAIAEAAASFADEAAENWELHVSHADLERAIADFLAERPDRNQ